MLPRLPKFVAVSFASCIFAWSMLTSLDIDSTGRHEISYEAKTFGAGGEVSARIAPSF